MAVKTKETEPSLLLLDAVKKGMLEKKAQEILSLNLGKINSTVCDFFVICHGTSSTHVGAIAESVEEAVRNNCGIKPGRREGFVNGEWLLIDYLDVVVHIFQEPVRRYYQLEELWADVPAEKVNDI